ncbi:hypothetical protein BDW69DRAFT_203990 [Aspergillus filifer]
MLTAEQQSKFRPRRRHRKSRNGCAECKRRRIKCDEIKPSCSRCILTMQKCIYASTSPPPTSSGTAHVHPPEPSHSHSHSRNDLSLSLPTPSSCSGSALLRGPSLSPPYDIPRLSSLTIAEPTPTVSFEFDTSDTGLYHHYLQHTSRNLTCNTRDHHAIQVCLPTLALKSRTVYHSILAVSAACMCCDLITQHPPPDVGTVSNILMAGYRHYNQASERLRELISRPSAANAEPLLASPPLLVPFATSSQQINHWISNQSGGAQCPKPLASTPRDVIILSRGISATIRALVEDASKNSGFGSTPSPRTPGSAGAATLEVIDSMDDLVNPIPTSPPTPPPSHNHPMYHIIKRTSGSAFATLQVRLDTAIIYSNPHNQLQNEALSACAEAFGILATLCSAIFPSPSSSPSSSSQPQSPADQPILPASMTATPQLPQLPAWLADFVARPSTPSNTGYMTRPLLSFLPLVPMTYLDLTLPLLDQRLTGPNSNKTHKHIDPLLQLQDPSADLSIEQALALDIYAHWSVLMFLVGEESWWIGSLPDITLSGMVNRFGDGFVGRFWPDMLGGGRGVEDGDGEGAGEWWPRSMLRIQREIGRF